MITISQQNFNITLIILIIWVFVWFIYNNTLRKMYKNPLLEDPLTKYSIEVRRHTQSFICNMKYYYNIYKKIIMDANASNFNYRIEIE